MNAHGQLVLPDGSKLVRLAIEDELRASYLTYAMSVIVSRAIPDVRDGLKPSQRRVLVAMNDLHLGPSSQRVKCAKICGDTSGNYHPHGEAIVYPTLARLAQDWVMRYVLVDKQGNFGSIAGLPPAAMRYTEARLSGMAIELLRDLDLDAVDFVPTYDETRLEPTVLPSKAPNLLINGANGIAVGMATSIPPHNIGEICDACVAIVDNPDVSPFELLSLCPGPDFPTGGIICGSRGIRRGYLTGRGTIVLRARARIEENEKTGKARIVVSEIPYQQARDRIEEKIAEMVTDGKILGVSTIRNESDLKEPVRLVLELKRDANPEVVLNQLYKFTPLQDSFSIILLALVDGKPRVLTFKEMLEEFLRHRVSVIRRRTQFLLNKAVKRQHTVEGLLIALANIDEIIRAIRHSANEYEAKQAIMKLPCPAAMLRAALGDSGFASFQETRGEAEEYFLTPVQADAILRMALSQLVNLAQKKLADEYNALLDEIAEYRRILSDEKNILAIVREDLLEIKAKYGDKRRTAIVDYEIDDINDEDLIAEEQMVVSITTNGYIKRTPLAAYKSQRRGGKGQKGAKLDEDDPVKHLFVVSTHAFLMFFTNKGKVYLKKTYEIPQSARDAKGRNLVNFLALEPDETVAACLDVRDFDEDPDAYLIMATKRGVVKKTALSAFRRPNKKGLIAIRLRGVVVKSGDDEQEGAPQETPEVVEAPEIVADEERDALVGVAVCREGDEILLSAAGGRAIRFRQSDIRPMGRTAAGVRGMRLRDDDCVVGMAIAEDDAYLMTFCENGYGKRTPFGPNTPADGDLEDAPETDEPAEDENDSESLNVDDAEKKANSSRCYPVKKRGGFGVIDVKTTKRNGNVVAVLSVREGEDVLVITARGKIQRFSADDVRIIARNTAGVRMMNIDEGDWVVAVNSAPKYVASPKDEAVDGTVAAPEAAVEVASDAEVEIDETPTVADENGERDEE
ncbi:MAG: DNA topoisomerase (ATP-hydrolyzing) subunit A [Thermoguttaceae bacterium]|nr:DNA topoisomerase (ATP-hydrolyzing) subunit A [Thermoguttaceae bacterium]